MYLKNLAENLENVEKVKKRKDWIAQLNKSGLTKLQGESPTLQYAACTPRYILITLTLKVNTHCEGHSDF